MNSMFFNNNMEQKIGGFCFMNGALIFLDIVGTIQSLLMDEIDEV